MKKNTEEIDQTKEPVEEEQIADNSSVRIGELAISSNIRTPEQLADVLIAILEQPVVMQYLDFLNYKRTSISSGYIG